MLEEILEKEIEYASIGWASKQIQVLGESSNSAEARQLVFILPLYIPSLRKGKKFRARKLKIFEI